MMLAIVLLLVAGVGTSLAPWYELFLLLRFISALAIGGLMISSFVLSKCCNKLINYWNTKELFIWILHVVKIRRIFGQISIMYNCLISQS